MPYILYKTDGTKLTTVDDASLDLSTDLVFVGRNYSGYGQVVNENFLKLLENFSSDSAPSNPTKGQIWYNKSTGRLNVSYDGKSFKGIANIHVQDSTPAFTSLVKGDLWWDSNAFQLKAFDGKQFQVVGPFNPAASGASWIPGAEDVGGNAAIAASISKAVIDNDTVAIISKQTFTVRSDSALQTNFRVIKRGITLAGTDINGQSASNGTVLWGSASHALYATTASVAVSAQSLVDGGTPTLKSSSSTSVISYYNTATTATVSWSIAQRDVNGSLHANTFVGVATSARYADLAERYHADAEYESGTVLVIGGVNEVTVTDKVADTAVIGVVSTNPAVMMNSEIGPDSTHPYVALKGRVPCKVIGPVKKGEMLVTSSNPGYAMVAPRISEPFSIVGKALEDFSEGLGVIEILVV